MEVRSGILMDRVVGVVVWVVLQWFSATSGLMLVSLTLVSGFAARFFLV